MYEHLRRKKKIYACTWYRHECEPVVQMFNTADRVVAWGFMPLLGVGLYWFVFSPFLGR
jgi:hypothetical protein